MSQLDNIRRALDGVKDMGDGFVARCPAHDDTKQSLKVDPKGDGGVLLRCFAGCTFESIREALIAKGVDMTPPAPITSKSEDSTTRYEVRDPAGKLLATKVRKDPGKIIWWELPNGDRSLKNSGLRTEDMLYRVEVLAVELDKPVVICEGEKAARALYRLGVTCALGTVGGANASLNAKALEPLRGREVFLWPDNDAPGRKHMAGIRAKLAGIASSVYTIEWSGAPDKGDAADWTPGKTIADFGALAEAATNEPAPAWSRTMGDAVRAFEDELNRRILGDSSQYISTGLPDLDSLIGGGFKPGEVYLLGAPTGGGKTTLMQNFAMRCARGEAFKPGRRVLIVSPEMTLEEIGKRACVQQAGQAFNVWRSEAAAQPFLRVMGDVMALPIVIADKVDITMPDVVIEATRLAREPEGLGLVIVDYAQQVVDEEDARRPRYLAVGDVLEYSIKIAKSLSIPVLVASQVNVITERVKDRLRRDYTFRESGKLEHKASVVVIFDRRTMVERDEDAPVEEPEPVEAKLVCRKNRLGPEFRRIEVLWWKSLYRVEPGPWEGTEAPAPATLPASLPADPAGGLVLAGDPRAALPVGRNRSAIEQGSLYDQADD